MSKITVVLQEYYLFITVGGGRGLQKWVKCNNIGLKPFDY